MLCPYGFCRRIDPHNIRDKENHIRRPLLSFSKSCFSCALSAMPRFQRRGRGGQRIGAISFSLSVCVYCFRAIRCFISAFSPRIPAIWRCRTAKWARIYAEASAGLQIDRAYMRGALQGCKLTSHICVEGLHGCFAIPHICAVRCIIRQGSCRPARAHRRPVSCLCYGWGRSSRGGGSSRGLRSYASRGRRLRDGRG